MEGPSLLPEFDVKDDAREPDRGSRGPELHPDNLHPDNSHADNSHADDSPSAPRNALGYVPAVLSRDREAEQRRAFCAEFAPVGPLEQALVRELARHATESQRWSAAAEAVQRQAARTVPQLAGSFGAEESTHEDTMLACAMITDGGDRCERHGLARSRAFHRTLKKLEEVQDRRRAREASASQAMPSPFADEAACERYLELRLRSARQRCAKCGHPDGCYLVKRRAWECGRCGKQHGLRYGTVLAGSPLSLHVWFEAIRRLLWQPTVGIRELSAQLGLRRITTVGTMARRIRAAMAAEDVGALLADLDRYWLRTADAPCAKRVPEPPASRPSTAAAEPDVGGPNPERAGGSVETE